MAEPLGNGRAIPLLEESVHVLRQAPFSTLLCHWVGSVPLAMGVLFCWNSLTTERLSDSAAALEALGLALLLLWMNCWRAVFAGRLRRQLSAAPETPWTWRRAGRLIAVQSFLGALKLIVIPLAGLTMFPFANAVAFFRNAAVFSDREEMDAVDVMAKARALARIHTGQNWASLPILFLLQLIVLANLGLTFGVLPFLVRMLTGYESAFNRGEAFFVTSPLFLMFVLISSWAAFDPFVQAVYCVRCFEGESVTTGENLRVSLRRIAAVLLVFAVLPLRAADGISQSGLEQQVRVKMQSPEYGWRIPPPPPTGARGKPWVVAVTDKIFAVLKSIMSAIGRGIEAIFRWLTKQLLGDKAAGGGGAAPSTALHWSIYLLIAAVLAAAIWIAWRKQIFRRRKTQGASAAAGVPIRIDEEGITADQLPEERWLELAAQAMQEENFRLALRAFYLANLAWLGRHGFIAIHAGKTNREYELELRRRARNFPEARDLFGKNVGAFEAVWYGMHEASDENVAAFRERLEGMKRVMA